MKQFISPYIFDNIKLCEWCQIAPVKLKKNRTCSKECGSALRWGNMKKKGIDKTLFKMAEAGKKSRQYKRLTEEIERACKELSIAPTPNIRRLYVRARNKGYNNGYSCRDKRMR